MANEPKNFLRGDHAPQDTRWSYNLVKVSGTRWMLIEQESSVKRTLGDLRRLKSRSARLPADMMMSLDLLFVATVHLLDARWHQSCYNVTLRNRSLQCCTSSCSLPANRFRPTGSRRFRQATISEAWTSLSLSRFLSRCFFFFCRLKVKSLYYAIKKESIYL